MNTKAQHTPTPFVIQIENGFIWSNKEKRFVGLRSDDASYYISEGRARHVAMTTDGIIGLGAKIVPHPLVLDARRQRGGGERS